MQFIHITDPHVDIHKQHYGVDSFECLSRAVDHAVQHVPQADFLVVTGDVANNGDKESYRAVREILSRAPCPSFVVPGNHDNPSVMAEVFHRTSSISLEEAAHLTGGIWTDVLQTKLLNAVFLDTHLENEGAGAVSRQAMELLLNVLGENSHTLVFMHHPPFESGIAAMDVIGLNNSAELLAMLQRAENKPAGIFCGHLHRSISGIWNGIPVWCLRSTSHQVDMFDPNSEQIACCSEAPEYGLAVLTQSETKGADILFHTVRFTESEQVFDS